MPPLSKQTDENTLNDFLTESGELLERLDQDLVALEDRPQDPALLQGIFRAVHTIKGASSFMALEHLTALAHAAEDGLNALRQGQAQVTSGTMDLLLAAVDALKGQFAQLQQRQQPEPAPTDLLTALRQIAGHAPGASVASPGAAPASPAPATAPVALALSESKRDLLPFMAADLETSLEQVAGLWSQVAAAEAAPRAALAAQLAERTDEMLRAVEFFEIPSLTAEVQALHAAHEALPQAPAAALPAVVQTAGELVALMRERAEGLAKGQMVHQERTALRQLLADLIAGRVAPTESGARPAGATPGAAAGAARGDSTIRVEVARLEALLNLAGELVLQKNRVLALRKQVQASAAGGAGGADGAPAAPGDSRLSETFTQVASDLDRLTGDIQQAIMKTRLQPLDKLFSRYPRMVRDLGKATGKQIELVVQGADTEVDKTVLEALADPLVHLLRNCGDHGLELPEARVAAGKPPAGTITLAAQHQGHHVLIEVRDDGRGIDVARVGAKAVERGLVSAAELPTLSEAQVLQFIFAPGLSTAAKVSDLSGRGVGMDVVRTNLQKVGGLVDVYTKLGVGTTVSIRIPLTLAILPAMVVEVGPARYALPLANILEIVRPEAQHLSTIAGQPVLRRREQVLPLVDLALEFGHAPAAGRGTGGAGQMRFAVIAGLGERRVGLLVDRWVGQEEVVIKPLPEIPGVARGGSGGDAAGGAGGRGEGRGAASGATIRADGTVSLILDLAGLLASLDARRRAA